MRIQVASSDTQGGKFLHCMFLNESCRMQPNTGCIQRYCKMDWQPVNDALSCLVIQINALLTKKLCYRTHIELKSNLASFHINKACIPDVQKLNCSVKISIHGLHSASTLKAFEAVCLSAFRFFTADGFRMHCCLLYQITGSEKRTALHFIFIYKALRSKLRRSVLHQSLSIDQVCTELGLHTIWSFKVNMLLRSWLLNIMLHKNGTLCVNM